MSALLRSVRFRLALTYTVLVFGIAAAALGVVYMAVSRSLVSEPVTAGTAFASYLDPATGEIVTVAREVQLQFVTLEQVIDARTLEELRTISLWALVGLFPVSLAVGWFVADRSLRPIGRVVAVARDIGGADDLSRRIGLEGPDDELKELAETFDSMLDRIAEGVAARRRIVQDISHELRNPLAVMATTLDVALADPDADAGSLRAAAETVRRTVDRTARSVDDLVAFARDVTPATSRRRTDLAEVVDEVVDEHAGAFAGASVTVDRGAVDRAVVEADRDALKRAYANLVGNAARLTRAGSVVRVGSGTMAGWAWMAVDDDGPGIDPRDHEHIFRRFWSEDASSLRGEGRSGLGLAIARQVAEAHGGAVTVASELGAGAEFTLWLPLGSEATSDEVVADDGIHPLVSPLRGGG